MTKTKIIIAGIGGVGGYFGGLLAKQFNKSAQVEIDFIARGKHLNTIQEKGLSVIKGDYEFIAKPNLATDNPSAIGIADFIIICTKSYDLETTIQQLKPCINKDTIILPLLNGVDSREKIQNVYTDNMVLDGCVYIVAKIKEAGAVENTGNMQTLFFGLDYVDNKKLHLLQSILKQANIEVTLSNNISSVMWEKFIFISPTATATSYFNNSIGEIMADHEKLKMVSSLINEVTQIAEAKAIKISEDIVEKTLNKLKAFPFEATTSLHRDFKNKTNNNELELFTGYVVATASQLNIEVPTYKKLYNALKKK